MIFPSRKLVLRSPLPPAQALDAVQAELKSMRSWSEKMTREGGGGFTGTVTGERFNIRRDINYRNSFLPQISGVVESDITTGGSRITVRMAMHKAVMGFMCVWLFGLGSIGIPLTIAALNHHLQPAQHDWMGAVIPLGMLIFGLCLPHFGFRLEAGKAEKFLTETLKAQAELPPDANRAL